MLLSMSRDNIELLTLSLCSIELISLELLTLSLTCTCYNRTNSDPSGPLVQLSLTRPSFAYS
jgi:hypothetical protein